MLLTFLTVLHIYSVLDFNGCDQTKVLQLEKYAFSALSFHDLRIIIREIYPTGYLSLEESIEFNGNNANDFLEKFLIFFEIFFNKIIAFSNKPNPLEIFEVGHCFCYITTTKGGNLKMFCEIEKPSFYSESERDNTVVTKTFENSKSERREVKFIFLPQIIPRND